MHKQQQQQQQPAGEPLALTTDAMHAHTVVRPTANALHRAKLALRQQPRTPPATRRVAGTLWSHGAATAQAFLRVCNETVSLGLVVLLFWLVHATTRVRGWAATQPPLMLAAVGVFPALAVLSFYILLLPAISTDQASPLASLPAAATTTTPPQPLFVRYAMARPPAGAALVHCDDLARPAAELFETPNELCPEQGAARSPALLQQLHEARRNGAGNVAAAAPIVSLADLYERSFRALDTMPALPCVCAPMFGFLYRYMAVRTRSKNETASTQVAHLFNPEVVALSPASDTRIVSERQDVFLSVAASASTTVNVTRANQVRIAYVDEQCRARQATVTLALAHCTQACADLLQGHSIYERAPAS
jgi:peptide deformylase